MILALTILFFLILSLFSSDINPFVWPDEVLFFNPSYEWYKSGILRTTVLDGLIPGMGEYTLWMPAMYMLTLGSSFYFWDATIQNARMLSVGIGLIAIGSFYSFLKSELKISFNKKYAVYATLFILTDVLFFRVAHTARMETICILFGIGSIFSAYQQKYFKSGIFLALSFLSHPFGIFYGLPIFYLWVSDYSLPRLRTLIYISLGSLITLIPWLLYVVPQLDLFFIQFGAQLSRKRELFTVFSQLDKIKIYFSGYYFFIPKAISILAILILSFFSFRNVPKKRFRNMLVIWFISMLVGFYISSESWYVVHSTFPLAIFFAIATKERNWFRNGILGYQIFLICYMIYAVSFQENAIQKTQEFNAKVLDLAKDQSSIYIQLIPDPYFALKKQYPEKRIYEFIPGELSLSHDFYQSTIESIDLFLFYNEKLINSSILKLIQNSTLYKREVYQVDYNSRVPGKGPWMIYSYKKIPTNQSTQLKAP